MASIRLRTCLDSDLWPMGGVSLADEIDEYGMEYVDYISGTPAFADYEPQRIATDGLA